MIEATQKPGFTVKALLAGVDDPAFLQTVSDEAMAMVLNRIRDRYLRKVDENENPWVPSAAGLRREAKGLPGTLFKTGTLWRSIQAASLGGGTSSIFTDVPYAPDHQLGINGMIQRSFLAFGEKDTELVTALVAKRITDRLNQL